MTERADGGIVKNTPMEPIDLGCAYIIPELKKRDWFKLMLAALDKDKEDDVE